MNVATLTRTLIESELFGHEKGAFTDAKEMKQGLFELSNNGTLFLDEIGELPLDLQSKLLTVIEEGAFFRVGGKKQLRSTPKIIFATNRDLEKMVEDGSFRKDLYMRISMFPIRMPTLLERKEDIPDLIRSLLPRCCQENHVQVLFKDIPQDFIEQLMSSPVDGNIRGLLNQLDRLLVLSPRDKNGQPVLSKWRSIPGLYTSKKNSSQMAIIQSDAPLSYRELMSRPWNLIGPDFPGLNEMLEEIRSRLFKEAISKFKTNRAISRVFGISESTISLLMKRRRTESHGKDVKELVQ